MSKVFLFCAALSTVLICTSGYSQSHLINSVDRDALNAAADALCSRQIAMLGESPTHGDGHTTAFKVALVEQLIDQCGFNSVLFEASHYEFINLNRRLRMHQPVAASDVLSAVGGLWEFDREFQPLASFLLAKASEGTVFLGGLDDQLGQRGQDYANIAMVSELTSLLPNRERLPCSLALHKRIYYEYTDTSPYSRSDRQQIADCLSEIKRANTANRYPGKEVKIERQEMVAAAQRCIDRDFASDSAATVGRDRSMFRNFKWLVRQQPTTPKIIIWSATVHIAKQGDPTWGDRSGTNFGSLVHKKYGRRAFSLGFSALGGSYKGIGKHEVQDMPAAPGNSVEAQAFRGTHSDATFIDQTRLAGMGIVPGAFFRHSYQTLQWSAFLDGVVVFRQEFPPRDALKK